MPMSIAEMREKSAIVVLQTRAEILRELSEAKDTGNTKLARRWASELRKIEKLISDYGLERWSANASCG